VRDVYVPAGGLVDVFRRVAGLGADHGCLPDINFLCSIPFLCESLRINIASVSPQTASCRPSFCRYKPSTQHSGLAVLLPLCLSELTAFAKSNEHLAIRQWSWYFSCLHGVSPRYAHRRDIAFSRPSHGTMRRPCF
jgi:hypothetical protein